LYQTEYFFRTNTIDHKTSNTVLEADIRQSGDVMSVDYLEEYMFTEK